jgi:hypothetical protein
LALPDLAIRQVPRYFHTLLGLDSLAPPVICLANQAGVAIQASGEHFSKHFLRDMAAVRFAGQIVPAGHIDISLLFSRLNEIKVES